jgi:hypothetical protein
MGEVEEKSDYFSRFIGEPLTAVSFVMDYLHPQFNGHLLTAIFFLFLVPVLLSAQTLDEFESKYGQRKIGKENGFIFNHPLGAKMVVENFKSGEISKVTILPQRGKFISDDVGRKIVEELFTSNELENPITWDSSSDVNNCNVFTNYEYKKGDIFWTRRCRKGKLGIVKIEILLRVSKNEK